MHRDIKPENIILKKEGKYDLVLCGNFIIIIDIYYIYKFSNIFIIIQMF